MQRKFPSKGRRGERGQTIALVAVSIVSLLAMAALAIDVVSLYVARAEIQRAADAAALAGAKAIADSGVTTLAPASADLGAAVTLATSMATQSISAVVAATPPINTVGGGQATIVGTPTFNFTPNNNPTVTVTLQQTNLPTFFARVFGRSIAATTASATAEAYNPANPPSPYLYTPIQPRGVKPWLIQNQDPTTGIPFVVLSSGAVESSAIGGTFDLKSACIQPRNTKFCGNPIRNPPV